MAACLFGQALGIPSGHKNQYMNFSAQLDIKRIQALTDSIFAVAMTVLILKVSVPANLTSAALTKYFFEKTFAELYVYFLSFTTLGFFWIGTHFHHHLIVQTDRVSSWLNIIFLMLICVIPFATDFLNHHRREKLSIIFYSVNLISISLFHLSMLIYAWKKKYVKPQLTHVHYKAARQQILIPVCIYVSIIAVSFFSTTLASFLFLLPVLFNIIPKSKHEEII
jgi:uncharacterized membrane protein